MPFQSIEEKIIYEKLTEKTDSEKAKFSRDLDKTPQALISQVSGHLYTLAQTGDNTSFRPLTSYRKSVERVVIFIKRVIRKLLFWYVEPVCRQQTDFNRTVTSTIGHINETNQELLREISQMETQMATQMATQMETREINQAISQMSSRQQAQDAEIAMARAAFETTLQAIQAEVLQREAALQTRLEQLQEVQHIGDEQLILLQTRMDKLHQLDLDIFKEERNDAWDINTRNIGTFAQCGEDMIVSFVLGAFGIPLNEAAYVDLGANHAKKLSNTYHFYQQGARGVLVEANPALIPELKFYRSGDLILNRCVSMESGMKTNFYIMGDNIAEGDGLSTANKDSVESFVRQNPSLRNRGVVTVGTISAKDVIENHLGKTPVILNIDIEGDELSVLKSIDLQHTRPFVIIVEMIAYSNPFAITEKNQEILDYLTSLDYLEYAFTGINSIFLDKAKLREKGGLKP